uniref:PH domain-containing protein n=1 Tax=Ramularia collo-cygni TaxID=112498 RepID=A0A2D3VFZ2_9PEZI
MAEMATITRPSRYKSQRRKVSAEGLQGPDQAPSPQGVDGVVRSKSRYHRRPGTAVSTSAEHAQQPTLQSQPEMPSRYHSKNRQSPQKPLNQVPLAQKPPQLRQTSSNTKQSDDRLVSPSAEVSAGDFKDEEDTLAMNSGHRRLNREQSNELVQSRSPPTPSSVPVGDLFPPPKATEKPVRHDGPPQSGQIRATRSLTELPHYDEAEADTGCFGGWFKRKRGEALPAGAAIPRARDSKGELLPIRPGGGGIVPGIDAPVSAVNAGDRLVLVEFGRSQRVFPVTPTTTSVDIIKSASICMSGNIDVKSAVLLEYFSTVGVQRPLRRYEYVRSVMNSWDSDKQNSLLLVDPASGIVEPELTMAGVPKDRPEEQSWYLFYSQKMGKWEKRFVILRPDGQIVCQKEADKMKEVANVCHLSDFDVYTPTPEKLKKKIKPPKKLCYAIKSQQKTSMFETTDNFVHFFATGDKPTAESFHKAIQGWRSWYLVNVLGEGMKEEPKPAATAAVTRAERQVSNENAKTHRVQDSVGSHYQLGSFKPLIDLEVFEKPEPTGSSQETAFTKSANQFDVNVSPERRNSTARRRNPPGVLTQKAQLKDDEPLANLQRNGSVNKRTVPAGRQLKDDEPLANLQRNDSVNKRSAVTERRAESAEFKNTGLLGRQYSQRRKNYEEKEAQPEDPWTAGPNLLNGRIDGKDGELAAAGGVKRQSSMRRQGHGAGEVKRSGSTRDRETGRRRGDSGGLQRTGSVVREKPKPLIDLTPEHREAPQFSKKAMGKGFVPGNTGGGGLIDSATSPEDLMGVPASTDWRRCGSQAVPTVGDANVKKIRGQPGENTLPYGMADDGLNGSGSVSQSSQPLQRGFSQHRQPAQTAFTGEGLLGAQEKQGWGGHSKGRGVIDGSRANGKPLVDLNYNDTFANGSLLNKVQRSEGIPAPIVDREK